jgi:hypothetical protein
MNVILFPLSSATGGVVWVAQCIEKDFAAQGVTIKKAQANFQKTIKTHLLLCKRFGEEPFKNVPEAPQWFASDFKKLKSPPVKASRKTQDNENNTICNREGGLRALNHPRRCRRRKAP